MTLSSTPTSGSAIGVPIKIDGTHNLRSAEGYRTPSGTICSTGLFRSDALDRLSADGATDFLKLGVSRIIDLRERVEVAEFPTALPAGSVEIVNQPIFEGAAIPSSGPTLTLFDVYRTMVADRAASITQAVMLIAQAPPGAVLVHCTAGKDRTGVVVGVALSAVGVSRADVLADYAASGRNLAGPWAERTIAAHLAKTPGPLTDTFREFITASPVEVLADALSFIDETYGGSTRLLRAHGMSEETLQRLRVRLVD